MNDWYHEHVKKEFFEARDGLFRDPDASKRHWYAGTLIGHINGNYGTEYVQSALAALCQALVQDTDPGVRAYIAEYIGKSGQPNALPALGRVLCDPSLVVRWATLIAIFGHGSETQEVRLTLLTVRETTSFSPWA